MGGRLHQPRRSAFPELKGKKFWLSEVRPRSDEDNRCQRQFRESLIMAHYSLMALAQPDFDGFNHHQILALSGGLYQSNGRSWQIQWRDAGGELPDFRAPAGRPRLDVGSCGVMYRILTEGVMTHPFVLGCEVVRMAANEGLVPKSDFLDLEIGPHTVQSVTVRLRK